MRSAITIPENKTPFTAPTFRSCALAFAALGFLGGTAVAMAGSPAAKGAEKPDLSGVTGLKEWGVKAENLSPRGHNPLYFPLKPGFKFVMEYPDSKNGYYRKEVIVLDETEPFDVPGFGKFEAAVVQEEEFFDGVWTQQALNWFAIDKTTNAVYAFGELSWEVDHAGRKIFAGTWRVGEPDGNGIAEPGLLMPAEFKIGDKYLYEAHELEAHGYSENREEGLTMKVPAGTFKDCVKVREFNITDPDDITDKWWCKGVGIIKDTSDGELVESDGLPGKKVTEFGKFHKNPVQKIDAPVAKIDGFQASEIALKKIPGEVNSVKIERKGDHNVYAVEIIGAKDGVEWDVFVDIETGEIVGTDN
ncbi:PepSY domain-containing protein [Candidatus Thiosymbion oneisti]|uniref:PepSY domain-containing protein n=1 Tax=Candidatus Thiosymbion oneisti TaxID=589554 RepID=UPI000B7F5B9C|nr:PepSY domain-containing protein [Candidatus Thiosymbion oneisti]